MVEKGSIVTLQQSIIDSPASIDDKIEIYQTTKVSMDLAFWMPERADTMNLRKNTCRPWFLMEAASPVNTPKIQRASFIVPAGVYTPETLASTITESSKTIRPEDLYKNPFSYYDPDVSGRGFTFSFEAKAQHGDYKAYRVLDDKSGHWVADLHFDDANSAFFKKEPNSALWVWGSTEGFGVQYSGETDKATLNFLHTPYLGGCSTGTFRGTSRV